MSKPSLRGATAVVGAGGTKYFRRGAGSAEKKMLLEAVVAACRDGGIDPHDVDGFASYGDGHDEGPVLATSLGIKDFKFSVISSGGGGGIAGAIAAASAAVYAGIANNVIVYRTLAQAESGRQEFVKYHFTSMYRAQGIVSAVQSGALKNRRMLDGEGVPASAVEAFVRASYFHGSRNPDGLAFEKPLSSADYNSSRMIADPNRVFDCSRESDGAFAILITSAERARGLTPTPAYILAATQSGYAEDAGNSEPYVTSGFIPGARRLWAESGYGPEDVKVAQVYENTAGPAVLAMIDHGFTDFEGAGEFFTYENLIAPDGKLPINTAGGNVAAGFVHGMGLPVEAVRQIKGQSPNQVQDADLSLFIAGPQAQLTGSVLFGSERTL
ncbi:thiolase C-terminal domain-containing protein [Gordonia sp. DT30]|uniref:thiolase C-terminal domain-containing protein n=1 Tax=Gordonia sp. DT30 TaxID=3416546 RepID=UPI003CF525B7